MYIALVRGIVSGGCRWARPSEYMRGQPKMIYLVYALTITQVHLHILVVALGQPELH